MDNFVTVFVLEKEIFWPAFVGIIAASIALLICTAAIKLEKKGIKFWRFLGTSPKSAFVLGTILLASCFIIFTCSIIQSLRYIYAQKHSSVAEGIVNVIYEQPYEGANKGDIVRIGNKEFEKKYSQDTPHYVYTIAHGGILKEGVYARVYYYKDWITKIGVSKVPEQHINNDDN